MQVLFHSTKNKNRTYDIVEASLEGLASDSGLIVPQDFPEYHFSEFENLTYQSFAQKILEPFFKNTFLENSLEKICNESFNIPLTIFELDDKKSILELFHGPTLAFKDFGALFYANCMEIIADRLNKKITILVATSGDTGAAAASAIHKKNNLDLILLYPTKGVSNEQELFLNRWAGNIHTYKVDGSFDDCQKLVKEAFKSKLWQNKFNLNTVNSINILRVLAQMTYYCYISFKYMKKHKRNAKFIIPSGNFGNGTSAYWAKHCGFPIDVIHMPVNANKFLPNYLSNGDTEYFELVKTMANAMDVAKPSNFERIKSMYSTFEAFKKNVHSKPINDNDLSETILYYYKKSNYLLCPHTAIAVNYADKLVLNDVICVATASPVKFSSLFNSRLNIELELPQKIHELKMIKESSKTIKPVLSDIYHDFCF